MSERDHYFKDSNDNLWVNMTAVRESGSFEILPVSNGAGEITLPLTECRVGRQYPSFQAVLTKEADRKLVDFPE